MIIDGHAHIGTWLEPGFAGRGTTFDDALALYGDLGFHGALVMPTDRGDNAELRRCVRAHSDGPELRMAWWVDPSDEGAFAGLDEARGDIAALKIHPSFLRRPITDEAFRPFLRRAVSAGLPVVVHCGRWREVAGFERALDVAAEWPDLKIVLSHMGGDEPLLVRQTVAAIGERSLDNVYLGTESVRQYWVVQEALDQLGPERLVYGSDYNLNHPAAFLAIVQGLRVDDEGRARILGGNLNALLPPAQRFTTGSPAS